MKKALALGARLGSAFGIVRRLRTHSLAATRVRHTAVTEAVREEGLVGGQKFARHSDPKITMVYVDGLEDVAGRVAGKVAAVL